jgi:hypothetical protein
MIEVGSWTRRRPIGLDYAAAKDAEGGKERRWREVGRRKAEKKKVRSLEVERGRA